MKYRLPFCSRYRIAPLYLVAPLYLIAPLFLNGCEKVAACGNWCDDAGSDDDSMSPGDGDGDSSSSGGNQGSGGGGPGGGASSSGGNATGGSEIGSGEILIDADFNERAPGLYEEAHVVQDFGIAPSWNDGLDQGRASVVEEGGGTFLRVTYPAGEFGPGDGGVQFKLEFETSYDELYLTYRLRFGSGFEWVKGGKLPGLIGGTGPTGCKQDDTGFSARMMWRTGGVPVQYLYYPTKVESCGDDFPYQQEGSDATFVAGTWHQVRHRIVMNTPGMADGILQAWLDGQLMIDVQDFEWRGAGSTYGINGLYFSTFFGGSDATWAPTVDQTIDYDDFVVSTGP